MENLCKAQLNPDNVIKFNDKFFLRFAGEGDTKVIHEFIKKKKMFEKKEILYTGLSFNAYINPIVDISEYSELHIRHKLMNYIEEYLIIERNNEIDSIISFKIPEKSRSKVIDVSMMIFSDDFINYTDIFDISSEFLKKYSLITPTKLRIAIEKEDSQISNFINLSGFRLEYKAKLELGSDRDIIYYYRNI